MNAVLPIVFLMFLVCFVGNTNGIRCYFCASDCSDPFDKTKANATSMISINGWCMKFKSLEMHKSALVRSPATSGLCTKNKCKSVHHNGFDGTACCCNTDLCNNSNTIAKSLRIQCQTPAIDLSCDDCTSSFCAMHVKGCQGSPPCQALCQDPSSTTTTTTTTITSSSSTTTPEETTSSMEPSTTITVNGGFIIRFEFFIISFSLILLNFFN